MVELHEWWIQRVQHKKLPSSLNIHLRYVLCNVNYFFAKTKKKNKLMRSGYESITFRQCTAEPFFPQFCVIKIGQNIKHAFFYRNTKTNHGNIYVIHNTFAEYFYKTMTKPQRVYKCCLVSIVCRIIGNCNQYICHSQVVYLLSSSSLNIQYPLYRHNCDYRMEN